MSTLPAQAEIRRAALPDYIPARMVNEFVYCPRLFFYEWVEGLFRESADTVAGKAEHRRVDSGTGALAGAEALEGGEELKTRSVTLSSDRHQVIAKMDLVEVDTGGKVTPVDYKHGKPRTGDNGLDCWPADRVQLAVQCLVLRDNGYQVEEGLVFYVKTRQRVRVPFTAELVEETIATLARARATAASGRMPPPLADSPKCPGCSLAGICLPDETAALMAAGEPGGTQLELFAPAGPVPRKPPASVRRLVTPRAEKKPLYLNTQGCRVGKTGNLLRVKDKDKDKAVRDVRVGEICQVNVMGNVQLSTQAVQTLCRADVPICYFSMGGWFYGITRGLNSKNIFLRRAQFRLAEQEWFRLKLARDLVAGKIRNQRTMLQRNHIEPRNVILQQLKEMVSRAETASRAEELLGIEGNAARLYFGEFSGMLKSGNDGKAPQEMSFNFTKRNRRPPRDPVNALLSLAYSLLTKDLTIACYQVGFDPFLGFYHQPRFGRPALALDLVEPFRPLIAESAVLSAINTRMVTGKDFVQAGRAVSLTPAGRKAFFRAYEQRMDTLVTHPLFGYRVSYRRLLEVQARLLGRLLEGEISHYPVFVTR